MESIHETWTMQHQSVLIMRSDLQHHRVLPRNSARSSQQETKLIRQTQILCHPSILFKLLMENVMFANGPIPFCNILQHDFLVIQTRATSIGINRASYHPHNSPVPCLHPHGHFQTLSIQWPESPRITQVRCTKASLNIANKKQKSTRLDGPIAFEIHVMVANSSLQEKQEAGHPTGHPAEPSRAPSPHRHQANSLEDRAL